jgi:hypothetical protein
MSVLRVNLANAATVNITCKRGDTFSFGPIRFWSDAAKTIPINITAYTFAMKVKDADDNTILTFTGASEFVVTSTNILTITKLAASMVVDANEPGIPYSYDLEQNVAGSLLR